MRKSNSIFKTAFVSESGAELTNKDYFAYVEFDDYACYVLASGITDFETSEAAKEAVEHLILSFEEHPSMSKGTLARYMKETNERLLNSSHAHRLKASVIMIVTDYEKFRYTLAGNVRLRMYRSGRFFTESTDMSLAADLIKKGESETPLDRHEERHNLYTYLGKKDFFKPFVSKTQKLNDADIITIYTQGLWEHVDSQEIDEIFAEATDNPQETVDLLEEIDYRKIADAYNLPFYRVTDESELQKIMEILTAKEPCFVELQFKNEADTSPKLGMDMFKQLPLLSDDEIKQMEEEALECGNIISW